MSDSDGRTLAAVSVEATWFTATIGYDAEGNLTGLSDGRIGPLRGVNGKSIIGRGWTTAEGLAQLNDGSWLVAFERNHRIWRYSALGETPVPIEGPSEIGRQPLNAGIKALTAMPDGRIVAISENYSLQPGTVVGWIGKPAGGTRYTWQTFNYAVSPDFRPTGMAPLPDGSFATIERAFDLTQGARSRVMHVPTKGLEAGVTVKGEELAVLARPIRSTISRGFPRPAAGAARRCCGSTRTTISIRCSATCCCCSNSAPKVFPSGLKETPHPEERPAGPRLEGWQRAPLLLPMLRDARFARSSA